MHVKSLLAGVCVLSMFSGLGCVEQPPDGTTPEPSVPSRLLLTGRGQVPPNYTLRWVAPVGVTVARYNVFRSSAAITEENSVASLIASPTAESLVVQVQPNTGTQFFRVSAVDAEGVETGLSSQLQVDTTARAAFRADAVQDEVFELFTVPLAGGTPLAVSGVVTGGRSVQSYSWSPDARWVAFIADLDVQGQRELYVSLPEGAPIPIKMSGATVTWAQVLAFAWSPDSQQLAFVADRLTDEVYDLYVVPLRTRAPRLVSQLLGRQTGYDGVRQFAWSPDATQLAFVSDALADNLFELFTVDVRTTAVQRASAALAPMGAELDGVSDVAWSPDSTMLTYLANATFLNVQELFLVPAIGGAVLNLSAPLASGGSVRGFAWAPDASRVAFAADKDVPGAVQLWTTLPDATLATAVSGIATPGTAVTEFAWSRDAKTLAFRGDVETPGLPALYAVDPDGADLRRISGALVSTTTILDDWAWSATSAEVAFRGTVSVRESQELFLAAGDGSGLSPTIPPLLDNQVVERFAWSADGSRLIYIADQESDEQFALYLAPLDFTQGVSTRLDGFLPLAGDVTHAATSPLCSDDVPAAATTALAP